MNSNMVAHAPILRTPQSTKKIPGGLKRLQTLTRIQRQNLVLGSKVQFVDHLGKTIMSGNNVTEMSIALFEAVSEKHELVVDGKIVVPEGILIEAVNHLVSLVLRLPTATQVQQFQKYVVKDAQGKPMENVEDAFKDLHLCCAADALGISSFTQRIFNFFFSRINTSVPPKEVIDIITAARNPTGDKLFKQMAYTMATKLHDGTFTTGDAFKTHYLPTNRRLSQSIGGFLKSFQDAAAGRDTTNQSPKARRQRDEAHQKQYKDWKAATAADKKKKQAEEAAQWKAAGDSYRQKVLEGKKNFTKLEVRYAEKVLGKRVPFGSGS
jgi:hypothetical protein